MIARRKPLQDAEADLYCTSCRMSRPREGGRYISFNKGKNRRWVCARHPIADCKPAPVVP